MTEKKRSQWNAGRLWETLTYFEVIPLISCLKRIFIGNTDKKTAGEANKMGVILVAGATGGVGKRVVRRLLEDNYQVRALVRDANRAKQILGDRVELFEADITIPETLTPQLMDGVAAIVCCTGTRVQPVEGDTPNREKYYQGIKFYLPEVVDSPEMVEYQGIKNLVQAAAKSLKPAGKKVLFDFANPSTDLKETWGAVDDVVMGGVSESSIRLAGNKAVFSGIVSTDNNGGFASVRTRNFNPPWDLSQYEGIELRVQGDGKRYKFIIRCESKWDGIGYCYSFDTVHNCWTTIRIPFADLIPVFRAKTVPDGKAFDTSKVYAMQLMLSKFEYDGGLNPKFEKGLFGLEVESIQAYGGKPTPKFVMVSSAGVTRPGRPGINLAEEPPAVRMNDQLGGILTWKLRGEEAVRQSGLTYTIVRPCALTEKPGDKVLYFDQGDNVKGQVSREAIASVCVQAIELPQACDQTFEVREEEQKAAAINWESLFANLQPDR
ncbi:MAG: CIA30 family protein [Prochloraceae cyanobacterium]